MISLKRTLPVALSVVAAALCGTIAFEISEWRARAAARPATTQAALPTREEPPVTIDLPDQHETWFAQTLGRPLFSPDRRPVEVGARGLPRLTGVVVNGSQRIAIFASPSGQHPIIVEAGGHVGTYQVQAIADAGVTVSGPQGTTVIRPIFDSGRGSGPALPSARAQLSRPAPR